MGLAGRAAVLVGAPGQRVECRALRGHWGLLRARTSLVVVAGAGEARRPQRLAALGRGVAVTLMVVLEGQ